MTAGALIEEIRTRYENVLEQVVLAAESVGRNPADIKVVVVSKTHPLPVLEAAVAAGIRVFGENYAEEAAEKIRVLPNDLEWHMIGHVQSRKAQLVASHFQRVHSLDSLKLAERLNRFAVEAGRVLPVMLEVNTGGEESKHGFAAWDEQSWPALLPEIAKIIQLSNLKMDGLMTMPPFFDEADLARPYFQKLRRLQAFLIENFPAAAWQELSMGTSTDYPVAVQEGATMIRVGTAILGRRVYAPVVSEG